MKAKRLLPLIVAVIAAIWFFSGRSGVTPTGGLNAKMDNGTKPRSLTVLFLGVDIGGFKGNTDSIMLLHADPEARRLSVLSIPRDTRVVVGGKPEKINAANTHGGPKLTVALVEELLDTGIDAYVMADYEAFKRFVDAIGGIDIMVDRNMNKDDPYQNLHINLRKGFQHLDGEKAMQFVRFRDDALGDITRVGRQQAFLKAVTAKLATPATAARLPLIIPRVFRLVRTDMSLREARGFYSVLKEQSNWAVASATLPGAFLDMGGISYWSVRSDLAEDAWRQLMAGQAVSAFDPNPTPYPGGKFVQSVPETISETVYDSVYETVSATVYGNVYDANHEGVRDAVYETAQPSAPYVVPEAVYAAGDAGT